MFCPPYIMYTSDNVYIISFIHHSCKDRISFIMAQKGDADGKATDTGNSGRTGSYEILAV